MLLSVRTCTTPGTAQTDGRIDFVPDGGTAVRIDRQDVNDFEAGQTDDFQVPSASHNFTLVALSNDAWCVDRVVFGTTQLSLCQPRIWLEQQCGSLRNEIDGTPCLGQLTFDLLRATGELCASPPLSPPLPPRSPPLPPRSPPPPCAPETDAWLSLRGQYSSCDSTITGLLSEVVLRAPLCAGGTWTFDTRAGGLAVRQYVLSDARVSASGLAGAIAATHTIQRHGETRNDPDYNIYWAGSRADHDGNNAPSGYWADFALKGHLGGALPNNLQPSTWGLANGQVSWRRADGETFITCGIWGSNGARPRCGPHNGTVPTGYSLYLAFASIRSWALPLVDVTTSCPPPPRGPPPAAPPASPFANYSACLALHPTFPTPLLPMEQERLQRKSWQWACEAGRLWATATRSADSPTCYRVCRNGCCRRVATPSCSESTCTVRTRIEASNKPAATARSCIADSHTLESHALSGRSLLRYLAGHLPSCVRLVLWGKPDAARCAAASGYPSRVLPPHDNLHLLRPHHTRSVRIVLLCEKQRIHITMQLAWQSVRSILQRTLPSENMRPDATLRAAAAAAGAPRQDRRGEPPASLLTGRQPTAAANANASATPKCRRRGDQQRRDPQQCSRGQCRHGTGAPPGDPVAIGRRRRRRWQWWRKHR